MKKLIFTPLSYQGISPSPQLKTIVQYYSILGFGNDHSLETVYFHPPCFENSFLFIFYQDEPIFVRNVAMGHSALPAALFIPLLSMPSLVFNIRNVRAIRVHFRPGVISSLYGISLKGLSDRMLTLGDSLDKTLHNLFEDLALTSSPREQVSLIEQYLMCKLNGTNYQENSLFEELNGYLLKNGYTTPIKGLARKLGYSIRNFNRLLNERIGVSATEFIRIHRFKQALKYLQQSPDSSLTQIAQRLDYYDQSHFIRDFKRLAGQSPGNYLKWMEQAGENGRSVQFLSLKSM